MIKRIKTELEKSSFVPFTIVTTGGKAYRVPTPDHISVAPTVRSVIVWFDDDSNVAIPGLHISSVERDGTPLPDLSETS